MPVTQTVPEGPFSDAPYICDYIDNRVLAANTAETVTVPATADWVIINYSAPPFYLSKTTIPAVVPAADIVDGTGHAVSPTYRKVVRGSTFSVISPNAGVMSLEFYKRD